MLKVPRQTHTLLLLADEVIRLGGRLRTVFTDSRASSRLGAMEMGVLTAVVESRSPPTVPQIGRSLGHPRQVIQRAANSLIESGLIETAANPDHKRAPLLVATSVGIAVKQEADTLAIRAADAVLADIDHERAARLVEDLHSLRTEIEAHLRARDE